MPDYSEQKAQIETDATKLETYWKDRNTVLEEDLDRINLVKSTLKTEEKNWIDNEPKVFFDTSRSLVSINPPSFRLPLSINFSPEEKDKMNKAERLLFGIYRTFDKRMQDRGECLWLWQFAYWVLLGWYSVFVMVQKGDEGVEFTADIWNPLTVYPEWDNRGLAKCLRIYETDVLTARTIAQDLIERGKFDTIYKPEKNGEQKVINYWLRKDKKIYNATLISGQVVKPLTQHKKLKNIPIHIGAVGSPDRATVGWQKRRGESIVASNRDIYDYTNAMIQLLAEILDATAYPNIVTKTASGQPPFKSQTVKGHGVVIPLRLQDQIELLKHAAQPQEGNILLQYLGNQRQKGSLPSSVYGSLNFELSGFALSQLLAAIKYKLGPYLNTIEMGISGIMADCLYQYKEGGFPAITLSTKNPHDIKRGLTYIEEFSKEDIPERIYVETTIPITSQFDKTQAILNAVQASQAGVLSLETLWEETLGIQDTEQEKRRLSEDRASRDPFVMSLEIILGLWRKYEQYKQEENFEMAEALKRYIEAKELELGITPQKKPAIPPAPPGVPPQQMPPEATGESPDMLRAATGTPPPGLKRLPESPEVRAAKQAGTEVM